MDLNPTKLNKKGNFNMSSTVKVFGCGGAGLNTVSHFNDYVGEGDSALIHPIYVDTSRSNLRGDIPEQDIFILDGVDGSGKIRAENHQEIANVIKKVLLEFEPGDLNIVVFSASGGKRSIH